MRVSRARGARYAPELSFLCKGDRNNSFIDFSFRLKGLPRTVCGLFKTKGFLDRALLFPSSSLVGVCGSQRVRTRWTGLGGEIASTDGDFGGLIAVSRLTDPPRRPGLPA